MEGWKGLFFSGVCMALFRNGLTLKMSGRLNEKHKRWEKSQISTLLKVGLMLSGLALCETTKSSVAIRPALRN